MSSSGVEFEEDTLGRSYGRGKGGASGRGSGSGGESRMSRWLIDHGFAKSGRTAQALLFIFVAFNIYITYLVVHYLL